MNQLKNKNIHIQIRNTSGRHCNTLVIRKVINGVDIPFGFGIQGFRIFCLYLHESIKKKNKNVHIYRLVIFHYIKMYKLRITTVSAQIQFCS